MSKLKLFLKNSKIYFYYSKIREIESVNLIIVVTLYYLICNLFRRIRFKQRF